MTKNNLDEHLTWFLRSPHLIPLLDYISTVQDNSCDILTSQTSGVASILTKVATDDPPKSSVTREGQRSGTESINNANPNRSTDDMARLQFPPSTGKKPRILSQLKAAPLGTPKPLPTPAATRSSGYGSPTTKYSTNRSALPSDSHEYVQSEEMGPQTPDGHEVVDHYDSMLDVDEIDLTERHEESTTSSAATVETFGEPKRIWREDSASRAEPLRKKGKKRTSDEYNADMLSPTSQRNSGKRGKIEQFTPETSGQAISGRRLPNDRVAVGLGPYAHRASPAQRDDNLTRSTKKNALTRSSGERQRISDTTTQAEIRRSRVLLDSPSMSHHGADPEAGKPLNQRRALIGSPRTEPCQYRRQGSVKDSEDEELADEEAQIGQASSSTRKRTNPHRKEPSVTVKSSSPIKSEFRRTPSQLDPEISQDPSPKRPAKQGHALTVGNQPTVSTTLSSVAAAQSDFRRSSSSRSTPAWNSPGLSTESVRQFLDMPHSSVGVLMSQLQSERKQIQELKVSQMMEDEGVSAGVERQVKATKQGLKSLEDLMKMRGLHEASFSRKQEIKKRLLLLIDADVEEQEDEEMLILRKEVPGLNQDLKKIECDILECLDVGGIWHRLCSAGRSENVGDGASVANRETHSQKVLIASTQMHRLSPGALTKQNSPRRDLQTQARGVWYSPVSSDQKENLRPRCENGPLRTLDAPKLGAAAFQISPGRLVSHKAPIPSPKLRDQQLRQSSPKRNDDAQLNGGTNDVPFEEFDDDAGFSRHMRSPSIPFSISEDFDHEGDEDDLLGAAEEAEQTYPISCSVPAAQDAGRSALQQITGNARKRAGPFVGDSQSGMHIPQLQYPWSKAVKSALRDRFHLHGFRHNQLEAINATLEGKDAFVLMPTGGGKSLCYQLPAVVQSGRTQGVTVVISPLLSLMQDQVDALQRKGIQACLINSEVTSDHRKFVLQALRGQDVEKYIQIVYITPEMINKSGALIDVFHHLHKHKKLARLVIDEAHCVSQWGHDFRPDYKALGDVRRQFPGVPAIALTATATENVKVDVVHNLGMDGCEIFTQSFNRPNLTYEVKRKGKDVLDDIATTINTCYRGQSGIVYCMSRKNCERIAQQLSENYKIKAKHYHAGMEAQEKHDVQKKWQAGSCNVIVATIAFGMGIDKPDVRFVIHQTIPKSLEGYYQETGRAGRDGKRSACYLYYGYGDTGIFQRMIMDGEGSWEQKERQMQMLRNVVQFCENKSDCRRVQILAYFNEHFEREKCNAGCDNCKSGSQFESRDFTEYAGSAINLVRQIQDQRVTLLHCVDVFRGSRNKKITELRHDEVNEHGLGSALERGDAERLFHRLVSEDALMEFNKVNKSGFANQYVRLGRNAEQFSSGQRRVNIQIRISPDGKSKQRNKREPQRKKSGTGVGVANDDDHYPASTNVSSPLQAAAKRRLVRKADMPRLSEDSSEGEHDLPTFEPIRERGVLSRRTERPLGPPITSDEKLDRLNATHRHVLDDFMCNAKRECSSLMLQKGLRNQPFSDSMLREMAINFPLSIPKLLEIDGIDHDKVNRYGVRFLKLVKDAHNTYEALMRAQEDIPDDPNHQNVVEISDDEQQIGVESEETDDHEFSDDETSQYFQLAPEVAAFNAQMSRTQTLASAAPKRQPPAKANATIQRGSSASFRGGRGGRKEEATGTKKWKDRSGASSFKKKKRKGSGYRTSNGTSNSGSSLGSKRGGGAGRNGSGNGIGRRIGLMPT